MECYCSILYWQLLRTPNLMSGNVAPSQLIWGPWKSAINSQYLCRTCAWCRWPHWSKWPKSCRILEVLSPESLYIVIVTHSNTEKIGWDWCICPPLLLLACWSSMCLICRTLSRYINVGMVLGYTLRCAAVILSWELCNISPSCANCLVHILHELLIDPGSCTSGKPVMVHQLQGWFSTAVIMWCTNNS